MKVTKRQLLQIIKEERAKLQEAFGVDQFYDFVDAVRAGIGYIADWDVARQWEGMFGVAPRGEELETILSKLDQLGMLRDEDEDMMEAAEPAKSTVRVTEAQLRRIVREAAGALNEEEFDVRRDTMAQRGTYGAYKSRRAPSLPPAEELSPEEMALNAQRAEALERLKKAAHQDQYAKVGYQKIDTGHRGQMTSMSPDKAYKSAMGALWNYRGASDPENRYGNVKDVSHHDMARIRHALEVYGLDGADLFVYQG
jgi:hypothetical protein